MDTPSSPPVIELRKFQFYPRLSEETNAYNAIVRVNGVDCIDASNDGKGGCDRYHPLEYDDASRAAFQTGMETIKAHLETLPPRQTRYGEMPFVRVIEGGTKDYAVDLFIGEIVDKLIREKEESKQKKKWGKAWPVTNFYINAKGQLVTAKLSAPRDQIPAAAMEKIKQRAQKDGLRMVTAPTFEAVWPEICAALFGDKIDTSPEPSVVISNDADLPSPASASGKAKSA